MELGNSPRSRTINLNFYHEVTLVCFFGLILLLSKSHCWITCEGELIPKERTLEKTRSCVEIYPVDHWLGRKLVWE